MKKMHYESLQIDITTQHHINIQELKMQSYNTADVKWSHHNIKTIENLYLGLFIQVKETSKDPKV